MKRCSYLGEECSRARERAHAKSIRQHWVSKWLQGQQGGHCGLTRVRTERLAGDRWVMIDGCGSVDLVDHYNCFGYSWIRKLLQGFVKQ